MFARHKIVWITSDGWSELRTRADEADRAALEQWSEADWPVIVRRRDEDAAEDQVCVGLPLPPNPVDGTKKRIALRIARNQVREVRAPLSVSDVLDSAPDYWRTALDAFAAETKRLRLTIQVYGSLAMQSLTKQRYITPHSDIDLLFQPRSVGQLGTGTGLLSYYANSLPLDGEIVFPEGRGVSWKEWIQAMHTSTQVRVLAKDAHAVSLKSPTFLLEAFDHVSSKSLG